MTMQATAERYRGERPADETIARAYEFANLSHYSFKQRFLIRAADLLFFVLIKLIGSTMRWQVKGWEHVEAAYSNNQVPVYCFWHDQVFLGSYYFRDRGIVVMTSQSFDGEYIARFIQRFGYGAARGSSTRGAVGAIVEMARLMRAGCPAGFTMDGPRGPRHVAKMGAVLLAKKTGQPIVPFSVSVPHWKIKGSWDQLQIPRPFSRAHLSIEPPIYVAADIDDAALELKRQQLEAALNRNAT